MILTSVTALLRSLLENGLVSHGVTASVGADTSISILPPDRIPLGANERAQLNVFLYQVTPKGLAFKNRYPSGDGTDGSPAELLQIELLYLISAYGAQGLHTELLLDYVMLRLQESAAFTAEDVSKALTSLSSSAAGRIVSPPLAALAEPSAAGKIRHLKIYPVVTTSDEMMNLWSSFQAAYRPSMTYKVIVDVEDAPLNAGTATP